MLSFLNVLLRGLKGNRNGVLTRNIFLGNGIQNVYYRWVCRFFSFFGEKGEGIFSGKIFEKFGGSGVAVEVGKRVGMMFKFASLSFLIGSNNFWSFIFEGIYSIG